MAISFPRTLIAVPGIESNQFGLNFNIDTFESAITRQKQYDIRPGARWEGILTLPVMTTAQARAWKAWFASMEGPVGTFYGFDPDGRDPVGIADTGSDTPLVDGASQTGSTCLLKGWRAGETSLLLPGDYVQIGIELKEVLEQLDSDGGGAATISFKPPFHVSPADNAPVVFNDPVGIFGIPEDFVGWESDRTGLHRFSFPIEEVI